MEMKLYERLRLDIGGKALFEPEAWAGGWVSGYLDMTKYEKVLFVVIGGGASNAAAELQIFVLQDIDNIGADPKVVPGKVVPTVTAGASPGDRDNLWLIHVEVEEMDVNNGFSHIALAFLVSGAYTWQLAAIAIRSERDYLPHDGTCTLLVD